MNKRISELYQAMLFELHRRLEEADRIFIRMSELLLDMMSTATLSETQMPELRDLDRQHRELLAEVVTELQRIYSGRIEVFPPGNGSFIENLERRNAQCEELERIVNRLLEENGCKINEKSAKAVNSWRMIMENINFKAEFERNFSEAEQLCKRPNILTAGYTGSGKTSQIRTILGSELVPAEGIGNSRSVPDRIRLLRKRGHPAVGFPRSRTRRKGSGFPGEDEEVHCGTPERTPSGRSHSSGLVSDSGQ